LDEETLLLAPEGMVTLTALKWTGVSPSVGNLVDATTVRAVAGAGGGVWPAAEAASAAAHTRKLPMVVDRMGLSLSKFISIDQANIFRHAFVNSTVAFARVGVRASCGKFGEQLTRKRCFLQ
jgi:hypothetical protein